MEHETSKIHGQEGRTPLHRDGQQWVLDYLIQETGKVFHFQGSGRGSLPKSVRSHSMISKHVGKTAQKWEALADEEAALGHRETALDFYYRATLTYMSAQHPVFERSEEKFFLNDGLRRCYDGVIDHSPYPIERVDVEWEGTTVSGVLHINPDVTGPAPLVFHICGCDVTKESWPHPHLNHAHQRGMHVFSFDGPGQGESNVRGIRLTADNYERAASAALDVLCSRDDVDENAVVLYCVSFGSFWGLRFAAHDDRLRAVVAPQATVCDKFIHMDWESPRWKQLFAFLTQADSESELNEIVADMTMDGYMERISAPTLLTVGEFDPRAPIEEVYRMYEQMRSPAVLWVLADQHHQVEIGNAPKGGWNRGSHGMMLDWLVDRLEGKPIPHQGGVVYFDGFTSPYSDSAAVKKRWYERPS